MPCTQLPSLFHPIPFLYAYSYNQFIFISVGTMGWGRVAEPINIKCRFDNLIIHYYYNIKYKKTCMSHIRCTVFVCVHVCPPHYKFFTCMMYIYYWYGYLYDIFIKVSHISIFNSADSWCEKKIKTFKTFIIFEKNESARFTGFKL